MCRGYWPILVDVQDAAVVGEAWDSWLQAKNLLQLVNCHLEACCVSEEFVKRKNSCLLKLNVRLQGQL